MKRLLIIGGVWLVAGCAQLADWSEGVSIYEAATFAEEMAGVEFDPGNQSHRFTLYLIADVYAAYRRGEIDEPEARDRIADILIDFKRRQAQEGEA